MSEPAPYRPKREDGCGCPKAAHCWGAHGWHWIELDRLALEERQRKAWADAGLAAEDFRYDERAARHYLGLPAAYERCKPYLEAVRRRVGAERTETTRRKDW